MVDFEYYKPASLDEALLILHEHRARVRPLAGGTDLIVQMKYGRLCPEVILDVKKIEELNRLEWSEDKGLFVGAAVPVSTITAFPPMASRYGMFRDACSLIGSFHLRNRATIGGNLCNAAPSADSAPPLLCLDTRALIARQGGARTVPLVDFFVGPGQTVLAADELLVGIEIPVPAVPSGGAYLRHIPRQDMDVAVTGVASFLTLSPESGLCREARIALGAVAPTPVRAHEAEALLVGSNLNGRVLEEAAMRAAECAQPISDMRGSAEYRRELVRVLTERTVARVRSAIMDLVVTR
jgi:aerobic carbon-monoxide dehydrogenase medium subunit